MRRARRPRGQAVRLPRPTRAAALLLVIATILEILGRLIHSTGVTVAAAAALGAVIGDAALSPRVSRLTVTREAADRLPLGVATTVRLLVTAPGGRFGGRRPLVLADRHPGLATAQVVTPPLAAGGRAAAVYQVLPRARGYWQDAGEIAIEAFSPLGGFVRRRVITVRGELWVHPAPATPYRLPDVLAGDGSGSATTPRIGSGTDFYGIREWRSGDPSTAVHWRASARRNQLVVMERERQAHTPLLIACGRATGQAMWEPALAHAAATGVAALRAGRRVVLLGDEGTTTPSTPRDVLDWFAALPDKPLRDPHTMREALRVAGPAATLLWLAEDAGPELTGVVRHGALAAVVSPLTVVGVAR